MSKTIIRSFYPKQVSLSHLLIFILIVTFFGACQSNRSAIKGPIKEEGVDYLMTKLHDNELKFKTLTSKFTVDYSYDRKQNDFKGQVRIVKDSAIWISFNQDLGIEIARFLITEDSVKFIDRINKNYFAGDYVFVNDFLSANIDFGILQSLLIGNDFEYYEDINFKASVDGKRYRLITTGRNKLKKFVRNNEDNTRLLLQTIWLDPASFKISEIRLKELTRNSKKLTAFYSDFLDLQNMKFPTRVDYTIEADVPVKVTVKHIKTGMDEPISMPFNVPEGYPIVN
ncbi:MAG: DUF4292 domain-containing protein [Bacteroidales bacterium]|nr:DUF4292 domain-containing protein [Bacteroidales bacterium]